MRAQLGLSGKLTARVVHAPGPGLRWKLSNFPKMWPGLWREALAKATKTPTFFGHLCARHIKADGSVVNYGLISTRLVTTAFVEFMVDQLQAETSEWGDFKFHDSGIGVTPAAVGDTDIETTDNVARATGSQTEGATGEIYKSVGTITYVGVLAITEHLLASQAAAATAMDHHVFSAINVVATDSIEFTYQLTVSDGG